MIHVGSGIAWFQNAQPFLNHSKPAGLPTRARVQSLRSGGAVSLACALCAHQSPKSALYQTHHSRRASSNFSKHERLRQSFQRLPVKAGNVEQSLKGLPKGFQRFFSNMKGFVKPFRNLRGTVYAPEVSNFEHVMFLSILLSSVLSSQASFRHWSV